MPLRGTSVTYGVRHFSALRGHGTRRVRADVAQEVVRSQQDANPSGIAHDLCFFSAATHTV